MLILSLSDPSAPFGLQQWLEFIGRLHPLVLHLPIGLLAAVFLAEAATVRAREVAPLRTLLYLALGASAAAAAATGWRLGLEDGYRPELVDEHRTFGVAAAIGSLLAASVAVFFRSARAAKVRIALLAATSVLFAAAGHRGGMMTHGARFLSQSAPPWLAPFVGPDAAPRAAADPDPNRNEDSGPSPAVGPGPDPGAPEPDVPAVVDAFRASCVECHGPDKQKGGLRLDESAGWLSAVDLESPADSELVYRITLPADDPDAMPPEGEPRISAEHVARLIEWIERGAPAAELGLEGG